MRVLWLGHVLPHPPQGGVLQRSYHLLTGAGRTGCADFVGFRQNAFHPDGASLQRSARALGGVVRIRRIFDLPVDRGKLARGWLLASSALTPRPYTVRWNFSRPLAAYLRQLAAGDRYDLVHFDTIGMFQYCDIFDSSAWVLNHHNIESHMLWRRSSRAAPIERSYLRWEAVRLRRWEQRVASAADLHIVVSLLDRDRLLREIPGARIAVVENPADVDFFRPGLRPERPGSVVFAGRIDAYPNAAAVRWMRDEIWPRLRRGGLARELWVVGRNPPEDILRWGRRRPEVHVTGYVEDVRPYLDQAEVYLCPIRDGGGTRLKVLDAMAMQMAVVGHRAAFEGLDVRPGEHVLEATDVDGLANAVERLLRCPRERRALGARARRQVEARYSVPATQARLGRAYRDAVAIRSRFRGRSDEPRHVPAVENPATGTPHGDKP